MWDGKGEATIDLVCCTRGTRQSELQSIPDLPDTGFPPAVQPNPFLLAYNNSDRQTTEERK